jgi:hypothetical protein
MTEPRLILKRVGGGYVVLPAAVFVSVDTSGRRLGVRLPRVALPADAARDAAAVVEVLFQPNPRDQVPITFT